MIQKTVFFGEGEADKALLGNKGLGLHEMVKEGLPIPLGFTVTTEAYHKWKKEKMYGLEEEIRARLDELQERTGNRFDGDASPLFVSVRSGAAVSMPGMMNTILNVGSTDKSIEVLARETSDSDFAYKTYKTFMETFYEAVNWSKLDFTGLAGKVTIPNRVYTFLIDPSGNNCNCAQCREHVEATFIEELTSSPNLEQFVQNRLSKKDKKESKTEIPHLLSDLREYILEKKSIGQFEADVKRVRRQFPFLPTDPYQQVIYAVDAVFKSWDSSRVRAYREEKNISHNLGTAVTIQKMVFGNRKRRSGTAVVFSSSPTTGAEGINGEYLCRAQGEELVSGKVTPKPLAKLARQSPKLYQSLEELARELERKQDAIQDLECTWESGKLYVLQRRRAEVTPTAKINFLLRRYESGTISIDDFIRNLDADEFAALTQQESLDLSAAHSPLTQGTSVLQGIITGRLAFTANDIACFKNLDKVIYCSQETSTNDMGKFKESDAVLTTTGGAYSHAALVALSLKKLCVVGCDGKVNSLQNGVTFGSTTLKAGDQVTIDGYSGKIYHGKINTLRQRHSPLVQKVTDIAKQFLNHLPVVYEAQCLRDLEEIRSTEPCKVVYSIDFDCFENSGIMTEEKLTSKERKSRIEWQAKEVYEHFQKNNCKNPSLTVYGTFNSGLAAAGVKPEILHRWYLKAFARLAQTAGQPVYFVENFVENSSSDSGITRDFLLEHKLEVESYSQYQNGANCILIQPWDTESGYLRTVQEVVNHEH